MYESHSKTFCALPYGGGGGGEINLGLKNGGGARSRLQILEFEVCEHKIYFFGVLEGTEK